MSDKKYYSLKNILSKDCIYNIIYGERSNGKTYAVEDYALKDYITNGNQLALVRRWEDDFTGKRGQQMFEALVNNGLVSKYSSGKWTSIRYYSRRWYLCKYDEETKKVISDETPFCFAFSLNSTEHDKSTSYPSIKTIFLDEFLTRGYELPDEFIIFMNVISTIVRDRNDVKIFMCGNSVNKSSTYFRELGINVDKISKGDIAIFTYGESTLRVAVEYSDNPRKTKPSDIYFAFNNPKLQMITSGVWEMALYPHAPLKWSKGDVVFSYFILFNHNTLQADIVEKDGNLFTYIHRKTTPIKDEDEDLIYSTDYNPKPNYRRKITKPTSDIEKKIVEFFNKDKVFYQDNEVGEVVRSYVMWCINDKLLK